MSAVTTRPITGPSLYAGMTTLIEAGSAMAHQAIDDRIPGDGCREIPAGSSKPTGQRAVGGEARDCRAELLRRRRAHEAVDVIADELQRAAGVECRDDRLGGEKRLQGRETVVLVERHVAHHERLAIQRDQSVVTDRAGEA